METPTPVTRPPVGVREIMRSLRHAGYHPARISRLLGGSVCTRTLYRWETGETRPLKVNDHRDLYQLALSLGTVGESAPAVVF